LSLSTEKNKCFKSTPRFCLQQQFNHIQHTFERGRDLVGVDFVKLHNRQEQLEHEHSDCLSQQRTTNSSTKYAEVLFAAAIHNRIQDTLERCRDLVGTYSASIIIITLSASIIIITLSAGIIIINPHGEDQKLDQERDQDVSLLAELQMVKKSSSIRAPANNRQHSGAPSHPL
jgi:hypothetical protein